MKQFYIFLLVLVALTGRSQTFRNAENIGIETPGKMLALGNKVFYTAKIFRINGCCNDSIYVIAKNLNGSTVFRKFIYQGPYLDDCDIYNAASGKMLIRIRSEFVTCDGGLSNAQMIQIDTLGNIDFSIQDLRFVNAIVPLSNGGFLSFSNNYLQQYNAQGVVTNTLSTALGTVSSAFEYSPSVIVGAFQSSTGPKLRILNSQYLSISEQTTSVLLTNLQVSADGGIIGTAGGSIFKYTQI